MRRIYKYLAAITFITSMVFAADNLERENGWWLPSEQDKQAINSPYFAIAAKIAKDNTGLKSDTHITFLKALVKAPPSVSNDQGARYLHDYRGIIEGKAKTLKEKISEKKVGEAIEHAKSKVHETMFVLRRFASHETDGITVSQYDEAIKYKFDTVPDDSYFQTKDDILKAALAVYLEAGREYILDKVKPCNAHMLTLTNTMDGNAKELSQFISFMHSKVSESKNPDLYMSGMGFSEDCKQFCINFKKISQPSTSLFTESKFFELNLMQQNIVDLKMHQPTNRSQSKKHNRVKSEKNTIKYSTKSEDAAALIAEFKASLFKHPAFIVDEDYEYISVDITQLTKKSLPRYLKLFSTGLSDAHTNVIGLLLEKPSKYNGNKKQKHNNKGNFVKYAIDSSEASDLITTFKSLLFTDSAFVIGHDYGYIGIDVAKLNPSTAALYLNKFAGKLSVTDINKVKLAAVNTGKPREKAAHKFEPSDLYQVKLPLSSSETTALIDVYGSKLHTSAAFRWDDKSDEIVLDVRNVGMKSDIANLYAEHRKELPELPTEAGSIMNWRAMFHSKKK